MSDIYIKMVLALPPDFFKDWKWHPGDQLLSQNSDGSWDVHYIGDRALKNGKIGWNFHDTFAELYEGFRPLPSQRQLQEMSGLDWDLYYHDILKNYSEYDSAEQAGLARVMYVKYHKKWDGETWI